MKPVKIYTTHYCGFCQRAKQLLTRKGAAFEEIDVTDDAAARQDLVQRTGQRTVPQIWIGETHVGGYSDLAKLDTDGKLDPLLQA